jgi:hypothetical protein
MSQGIRLLYIAIGQDDSIDAEALAFTFPNPSYGR